MEVTVDDMPTFLAVAMALSALGAGGAVIMGFSREFLFVLLVLVATILMPVIFGLGPSFLKSGVSYWLHFMKSSGRFTPEKRREFNYDKIRDHVFLGRQPRNVADLKQLNSEGITAVVTLNEGWELFVDNLGKELDQLGIQHLQVATQDFQGSSVGETVAMLDFIHRHAVGGATPGKVYVHCNAGRGRSALVVAAYLLACDCAERPEKSAWNPEAEVRRVITEMREIRPKVTPNLVRYPITGQSRALRTFAAEEAMRVGAKWRKMK
eukprot:TRINITY_DN44480_c0_g1_i1.p1 TRINITY_DN44480_c0_g1~~TRINITY_DN44480_c0_g1_i1.p1  ORF type:complete len:266 (-),score=32.18 TRINITY_DN44480_c0_g1_i1:186-983(-)